MPGVHVRKISQFDWLEQGQEPLLTVPGSYWLCYKQKIYKFTFKYHRNARDTGQFMHSKELLKITRRIIKCSPAQGQQFGTRNLLVTYHHTSWTRQDKMFAMLKFRERANTKTNSRAFVLSVKVCRSPLLDVEKQILPAISSPDNDRHLLNSRTSRSEDADKSRDKIGRCMAQSIICNSLEKSSQVSSSEKDSPEDPDVTIVEDDECTVIGIVQKGKQNTSKSSLSTHSLKKRKRLTSRKNERRKQRERSRKKSPETDTDDSQHFANPRKKRLKLDLTNSTGDTNTNETNEINSFKRSEHHVDALNINEISEVEFVTEEIKSKSPERRQLRHRDRSKSSVTTPIKEEEEKPCAEVSELPVPSVNKSHENSDSNISNHDSSHSSNNDPDELINDLPYQYLIEKEIENAKNNRTASSSKRYEHYRDRHGKFLPDVKRLPISQHDNGDSLSKQNLKYELLKLERRKSKSNKDVVKKDLDEAGLRSSNITDLVMEGLMLTIRQDRDSVSVVEQKTKLEVDEVLENSEKVETKEGEKCLVNSSLLKLENLITKIELSQMKDGHNVNENISSKVAEIIQPVSKDINDLQEPDIHTDEGNTKTNELSAKPLNYLLSSKNDNVDKALDTNSSPEESGNNTSIDREVEMPAMLKTGDEEEDIVPEILQQDVSICDDAPESNSSKNKDALLMDYATIDETEDDIRLSSQISLESFEEDKLTEVVERKRSSGGPKVLSTEIVTLDQMPPALQKALGSKAVRRYNPIQMVSKPSTSGGTSHEPFHEAERCGNADFLNVKYNRMTTERIIENDVLMKSEYVCEHGTLFTLSKNPLNNELEIHSDSNYRSSKSEEKTNSNTTPERIKQYGASGNKLQDITEDFFVDIHLPEEKPTDQRCLRQRKRPTRMQNSIRNNDVQLEMLKFIQHITYGAKVVVQRLSTKNISAFTGKNYSSLATCTN